MIIKIEKSKEKHKEGNPTDYQPKGECYREVDYPIFIIIEYSTGYLASPPNTGGA